MEPERGQLKQTCGLEPVLLFVSMMHFKRYQNDIFELAINLASFSVFDKIHDGRSKCYAFKLVFKIMGRPDRICFWPILVEDYILTFIFMLLLNEWGEKSN